MSGILAPGERLIETELADQFGTSRGPIRDAFKELENIGLVRVQPRRGTFVADFDETDIYEIYTLRLALETTAARLAAQNIAENSTTEKDLQQRLESLAAAHKIGDRRLIAKADIAFHRLILNLSGQRRLVDAWERVADQTVVVLSELSTHRPELQSASDHQQVAELIISGSGDRAAEVMTEHLERGRVSMLEKRRTRL